MPPLANDPPILPSGRNPQIAKRHDDGPVQALITAMPEWNSAGGRQIGGFVARVVPHVRKAVKWNTPFYGDKAGLWLLRFHCLIRYMNVAFFRRALLGPPPPGASKQPGVRCLDIRDNAGLDTARLADCVGQANRLPGDML